MSLTTEQSSLGQRKNYIV